MTATATARRAASLTRRSFPTWALALALALATFGLYGFTSGQLVGYEGETAAVSEGLVKQGVLRVLPGTPLSSEGMPGRGGYRYSRTGLAQPLLEAPFYFVGDRLDALSSAGARSYRWRDALLRLFNPAMAMVAVLAAFWLLLARGVSRRRAVGVAVLLAIGSLAWPYAKIGMDTTLMAAVAVAMASAAWAAQRPSPARLALAGAAAAIAITTKPYGLLLLAGVPALLWPALRALPRPRLTRALLAYGVPVALGVASVGWYNAYRTGSVTNFLHPNPTDLVDTPFNAVGLLLSPGKGLVFYSPLIVLGALGLRELRRRDRPLAWAILVPVAVNVVIIAATFVWSDDTWGPRYLIPTAWLLVLPIAWWVRGRGRRRALAVVALVAVYVQLVGVFAPYGASTVAIRRLTGVPVYPIGVSAKVPYGNDGPRWVPQLSAVVVQSEVMLAWLDRQLTGSGFTVTYDPTWGTRGHLDLHNPGRALGVQLPDLWWRYPGQTAALDVVAALLGLLACGGGAAVVWLWRREGVPAQ